MNQSDQQQKPWGIRLQCEGTAILELCLVIPFMLMLFFATIELCRIFRVREMMSIASVEAAKLAYRNCYDLARRDCETSLIDLPNDMSVHDLCLTEYAEGIDEKLGPYLGPDSALSINIYRWVEGSGGTPGTVEWFASTRDRDTGAHTLSRYRKQFSDGATKVAADFVSSSGNSIVEEQGFAVIAEMIIPYHVQYGMFFGFPEDLTLYELTIL